ncbi:MAG: hypothetical protein HYY23_17185 [Verrucomicrobia bacterium]|nr:hypothetical protein [Verrucomicrobiota bacterium]
MLLDLAEEKDFAHEFRETFEAAGYALRLTPTVLNEMVSARLEGDRRERTLATKAMHRIPQWRIVPFELNSIEEIMAEQFADRILRLNLLPPEEWNDAQILAETSVAGIPLLVTSDQHLLGIEEDALLLAFQDAELPSARVASPKRLLRALR